MKKVVPILLAAMMLVSMTAFAAELTPGTYTGSASSVGGPMAVEVTVDENGIQTIDVTEIHDSEGVYNLVVDRIPAEIIAHQSLNVDGVTGATLTSLFLKNAIKDALSQACCIIQL